MIAILDYDAGNIKSVEKAMQLLGQEVRIIRSYFQAGGPLGMPWEKSASMGLTR